MVQTDLVGELRNALAWALASPSHLIVSAVGLVVLAHLVPFITNTAAIKYPGPFLAKFTDFWLLRQAMVGHRFQTVHDQHKKHGKCQSFRLPAVRATLY